MAVSAFLAPDAKFKAFDNNGVPLFGGQLFTYAAGTTTQIATYTDWTAGTPNTNPVILNSRGEASVYLLPNVAYKFTLQDASGNNIWTVDQILNNQLITLYGGVDTGVANAYVINFVSNFSAYTDGIIIYFVAAHANTGASTINVNGLGVVPLTNQDGSALKSGQIQNNQVIGVISKGGNFLILTSTGNAAQVLAVNGTIASPSISFTNDTGSGFFLDTFFNPTGNIGLSLGGVQQGRFAVGTFTPTWTGFGGSPPTGSITYTVNGHLVTWQFGINCNGTSNATGFGLNGIPAIIQPLTSSNPVIPFFNCQDNGAQTIATGNFTASGASLTFWKGTAPPSSTGWTNSGTKGFLGLEVLQYYI